MMTVQEMHPLLHDKTGITFSSLYPGCIAETGSSEKARLVPVAVPGLHEVRDRRLRVRGRGRRPLGPGRLRPRGVEERRLLVVERQRAAGRALTIPRRVASRARAARAARSSRTRTPRRRRTRRRPRQVREGVDGRAASHEPRTTLLLFSLRRLTPVPATMTVAKAFFSPPPRRRALFLCCLELDRTPAVAPADSPEPSRVTVARRAAHPGGRHRASPGRRSRSRLRRPAARWQLGSRGEDKAEIGTRAPVGERGRASRRPGSRRRRRWPGSQAEHPYLARGLGQRRAVVVAVGRRRRRRGGRAPGRRPTRVLDEGVAVGVAPGSGRDGSSGEVPLVLRRLAQSQILPILGNLPPPPSRGGDARLIGRIREYWNCAFTYSTAASCGMPNWAVVVAVGRKIERVRACFLWSDKSDKARVVEPL